ncbi:hypothetical protein CAPTEDRAFT_195978 [Capitella teleta]|uniref:Uncharacterized protein n=1 Tax=Capitella teleta TaxID=283909 RepID=R7TCJ8_CAPTE|nr:hypothetical protein CAPTEDRAFT_195978 [Capitella teleta]|eukprot:ELT91237.1 hypothetical protein CAPTEDRAFT_195978 [Capitella teleta]
MDPTGNGAQLSIDSGVGAYRMQRAFKGRGCIIIALYHSLVSPITIKIGPWALQHLVLSRALLYHTWIERSGVHAGALFEHRDNSPTYGCGLADLASEVTDRAKVARVTGELHFSLFVCKVVQNLKFGAVIRRGTSPSRGQIIPRGHSLCNANTCYVRTPGMANDPHSDDQPSGVAIYDCSETKTHTEKK